MLELREKSMAACGYQEEAQMVARPRRANWCRTYLPGLVGRLDRALVPHHPVQTLAHQTLLDNLHDRQLGDVWVGEHADLGAAALGGRQLGDHVGEVLADFAGRVGAEPEIGGGHLDWGRSVGSSNRAVGL